MNVKKGDIAIVIKGVSQGHIVTVGDYVTEGARVVIGERTARCLHNGWFCTANGSALKAEVFKDGKPYSPPKYISDKTIPIRDEWLKPVSGLLDEAEVRAAKTTK